MPTYSIMYVPQHKRIVRSSSDIVISIVVEHQLVINRLYTCSLPNCTRCGVLIDRQSLISYQYLPDLPGNTIEYLPTIIPCTMYFVSSGNNIYNFGMYSFKLNCYFAQFFTVLIKSCLAINSGLFACHSNVKVINVIFAQQQTHCDWLSKICPFSTIKLKVSLPMITMTRNSF